MVERVRITPGRIITRRDSSAISFDTDNRYFKTTNSGNLKTERLIESPLVQVSTNSAGTGVDVSVSSSGILLAKLFPRDILQGAIIRVPDTIASSLVLKITFGYRAGWFPTGTPLIGTNFRVGYSHSTNIIVTAYDANGKAKNFLVASNLKRKIDFIATAITYDGLKQTADYQGKWTQGATDERILSLEVSNVVPGSLIQVSPIMGPNIEEYFDMAPLCFYIRQTDKVGTGLGISP